jgi:hypothetical protein
VAVAGSQRASCQTLSGLTRPNLTVLHPVDDTVVSVTEGERIFTMARQPVAFVPRSPPTTC